MYRKQCYAVSRRGGANPDGGIDLARMVEATDASFDPAVLEILRDTRKLCPKCERQSWRRPSQPVAHGRP